MRWTGRLQGPRLMKFEELRGRTRRGVSGQRETAEIVGRFGVRLPALARPLRGGKGGGVARPLLEAGLGTPRRYGRGGASPGVV